MQISSMISKDVNPTVKWYVMRDLKRANDKSPAYKVLAKENLEVFTPLVQKIVVKKNGAKGLVMVPFLPDLLFIHSSEEIINVFVDAIPTLQYRYVRGGSYKEAMIVDEESMQRFIHAVESRPDTRYYNADEISSAAIGSLVKIVGGPLDGYVGNLLRVRGSKKKRLLVKIQNMLTAAVEVEPEYVQILKQK